MTPERIAEIKALLAAARPLPWEHRFIEGEGGNAIATGDGWAVERDGDDEQEHADYALIVAGVNALPELIAEVERLGARLDGGADEVDTARWAGAVTAYDVAIFEAQRAGDRKLVDALLDYRKYAQSMLSRSRGGDGMRPARIPPDCERAFAERARAVAEADRIRAHRERLRTALRFPDDHHLMECPIDDWSQGLTGLGAADVTPPRPVCTCGLDEAMKES
jgi:hypothetical protein